MQQIITLSLHPPSVIDLRLASHHRHEIFPFHSGHIQTMNLYAYFQAGDGKPFDTAAIHCFQKIDLCSVYNKK